MNPTRLMMVTTGFPYGQGESFVEAELNYVSAFFDDVTLVPSFYNRDEAPRTVDYKIEPAYADTRWGGGRTVHVVASFLRALWRYQWLREARSIMRRTHRLENIKELVRSLYRARLFEQFLERQFEAGHRFELIYFYWIVPEIAGALSFRRRRLAREANGSLPADVPVVVARAHGGDLYEERRRGGYAGLTDSINTGIDAVYCISEHGRAYLANKYPGLTTRFHLARLGVDDPGFLNPQPLGEGLSILSCSFMVPGKRIHLIIDAIAVLVRMHPHLSVRWTHIGDGELLTALQAQSARLLAPHAVDVCFKGYLKQADVIAYYRQEAFDVIINVSDSEGIPVSLMEAGSVGIPMIATDVGGSGEIVRAAGSVLIDENASADVIADALMTFCDKRHAQGYRSRARAAWHRDFNAATNYTAFGQALRRAMERP